MLFVKLREVDVRVLAFSVAVVVLTTPGDAGLLGGTPPRTDALPRRVLWAWERPEDFRRHSDRSIAVAYLARTVRLRAGGVDVIPRRQPLRVTNDIPLIAVTRIEAERRWGPSLRATDLASLASTLAESARARQVRAIQIDFDATLSQRPFYKALLVETRRRLGPDVPLSITALASWCTDDWLDALPIDEAVPMLFRMGPDDAHFRSVGDTGLWRAIVCRGALGLSTDEPSVPARNRRVYTFNPAGWTNPAAPVRGTRR
jgi:hypothetical protein